MWKRSSILLAVVALAVVTSSCIFDPKKSNEQPPPIDQYRPLTSEVNVLFNLQTAYNDRNTTQYENILDNNFTFFLSDGDVNNGLPVQWDRQEELAVTGRLFSRTEQANFPLATAISLTIVGKETLQWFDVIPDQAPDEVWRSTTAFYDFQIDVAPETKYIPYPNSKAQFTVRNAGTVEKPHWQLVEWHDLGAGN